VRKEGRSWVHPLLVLSALPNGLGYSRFGFSTSKHLGKATVRNRARRLMREAVRLEQHNIKSGWDVVFTGRKALTKARFEEVREAVKELLQRAGLWEEAAAE